MYHRRRLETDGQLPRQVPGEEAYFSYSVGKDLFVIVLDTSADEMVEPNRCASSLGSPGAIARG
eukprot:6170080-Pyramimonas_sp.AAC.1